MTLTYQSDLDISLLPTASISPVIILILLATHFDVRNIWNVVRQEPWKHVHIQEEASNPKKSEPMFQGARSTTALWQWPHSLLHASRGDHHLQSTPRALLVCTLPFLICQCSCSCSGTIIITQSKRVIQATKASVVIARVILNYYFHYLH